MGGTQNTDELLSVTSDMTNGDNADHFKGTLEQQIAESGATDPDGPGPVTTTIDDNGDSHWWGVKVDPAGMGGGGSDCKMDALDSYHQKSEGDPFGETNILLESSGTDAWTLYGHYYFFSDGDDRQGTRFDGYWTANTRQDYWLPSTETRVNYYHDDQLQLFSTDPATGEQTPVDDSADPPAYQSAESLDWFESVSNFTAGLSDSYTAGLTKRIRQAFGYDDVVSYGTQYATGGSVGQILTAVTAPIQPCGQARWVGYGIRTIAAVQGTGHALNAADAAKTGDLTGFAGEALAATTSFAKLNGPCFAAGTPLLDGWRTAKPIERFREGDFVLSRDQHDPTGPPVLKRVEKVFVSRSPVVHLHVGGQVIRTTAEHPFWAERRGFTPAAQLRRGDRLVGYDGQSVPAEEVYDTGETDTVYNLRVTDYHTYFVGSPAWGWNVWAHNADGDCGPLHHIATDKNDVSDARGGPWTPVFEKIFANARMDLQDEANLVHVPGHFGPHPEEYHQMVFDRLTGATEGLSGQPYAQALVGALQKIAKEATTVGSDINKLLTGN
jgi:hypothetical protein